jgi:hypothetical protein
VTQGNTNVPGVCVAGDLAPVRALALSQGAIHELALLVADSHVVDRIGSGRAVRLEPGS